MSDENQENPSAEQPASPAQVPASAAPQEEMENPFDMSQRRDFGALLAVLAILVLAAAGALVLTGKVGKLGVSVSLPEGMIARVGDRDVGLEEFRSWVTSLPQSVHVQLLNADFRRQLLDQYLDRIVMLVYADKQGIAESDAYKKMRDEWQDRFAVEVFVQDTLAELMKEDLIRAYWQKNREMFPKDFDDPSQRLRMIEAYRRHIVFGMADSELKKVKLQRTKDFSGPVLAQMIFPDGETIAVTLEDYESTAAELSESEQRKAATPDGRETVLEQIFREKMLTRMAHDRKYQERPDVQQRVEELKPHLTVWVLGESALGDVNAAIEKEIQDNRARYERTTMELAHILVRVAPTAGADEISKAGERAKQIYQETTKPGADYAEIAKRRSEDNGSSSDGGRLGTVYPNQLPKPMAEAAFALTKGQVSEPVRTMFGFHVLKALSAPETSFDEGAARIMARRQLSMEAMDRKVAEIRQQIGGKVDEEEFAKWAPAPDAEQVPTLDDLSRPVPEGQDAQ